MRFLDLDSSTWHYSALGRQSNTTLAHPAPLGQIFHSQTGMPTLQSPEAAGRSSLATLSGQCDDIEGLQCHGKGS